MLVRVRISVLVLLMGILAIPQVALGSEASAKEIEQMLICPACTDTGMTVDYCPDGVAAGIRTQVEQKLAMGLTKEQIVNDHVAEYGIALLAKPPKSGSGLLAWVMPVVGVIIGGVLVYVLFKRRDISPKGRQTINPQNSETEYELHQKVDSLIKKYI